MGNWPGTTVRVYISNDFFRNKGENSQINLFIAIISEFDKELQKDTKI